MDFASFLIQTLNSLQYGLLLFLVASGLTLVFGIMGIINLAHGSFYMIGAYLAFVLTSATGSLVAAIALGIPLALAFGAFLEWALFAHLYKRDHLEQVLLTYGLILIFEQLRSLLVGDDVHGVAIPDFLDASIQLTEVMSYPVYRLAISVVCIVLAVALYYVIQRTRLGMMIRAGNDDEHGQPRADHLLRDRGHRRHRLGVGRARRRADRRLRRHLRQGAHPRTVRHRRVCGDGGGPAVAPRRHPQERLRP